MHQALEQKDEKNLYVEDGWIYFIHGWTLVIAEVFDMDIKGELFKEFERAAEEVRTDK